MKLLKAIRKAKEVNCKGIGISTALKKAITEGDMISKSWINS